MTATDDLNRTTVPSAITTPSRSETGIGTLEFTDGYPTRETAAKLRDHLDYLHGVEAFMNSIQGVSTYAIRQGFLDAGVMDGDVLIFSELMDSRSLFLTANADTVYFLAFLDLSDGPLVLETPSDTLGIVDDMWFGWITDFGLPGADRGQGGTYLLLPPGYDGPLPEGGCYVRHSATNHVILLGRAFIDQNEGNDPAPTAARIKEQLKIYPYVPGGVGSSIGGYLTGHGRLGQLADAAEPPVRGGHRAGDEHGPAERLRPLRDCSTRWCSWSRPRRSTPSWPASSPPSGSSRARSSRPTLGCGRSSTRRWPSATPPHGPLGHGRAPDRGLPLLRRRRHGLVEHAVRRRVRVHQPAADDHRGGHPAVPEQGRAPAALAHLVLLHRDRHHPGHVHAADQRRLAVPDRQRRRRPANPSTARRPTG